MLKECGVTEMLLWARGRCVVAMSDECWYMGGTCGSSVYLVHTTF